MPADDRAARTATPAGHAEERELSRYLRITNDFAHDMATGTWAACLLVMWVLAPRAAASPPEAADALSSAMAAVFALLLGALAVLGLTGAVRLGYWRSRTQRDDAAAKRRALVFKHAAFFVVYGAGTVWGWSLLP